MEQLPLFPSEVKNTAIKYSQNDFNDPDSALRLAVDILHILFSQRFENIMIRSFFNVDAIQWQVYYDSTRQKLLFSLNIPVKDRSTGDVTSITSYEPLTDIIINDELAFLRCVRRLLRNATVHEVDESFHYKGERIFDPHAKTKQ